MQLLKSLVDPQFNEDDVTILLVKRNADVPSPSGASIEPATLTGHTKALGRQRFGNCETALIY